MLCLPLLLFNLIAIQVVSGQNELLEDDKKSELSRQMTSLGSRSTSPSKPIISRSSFPAKNPHVCLAFLSCCGRTDLLNHTLAGTIRHMEEDEPSFLNYEIAWVDNGSGEEKTASIVNSFQIDHALILPKNSGLAYGMNLLINNLCTAPYILLLEEDWLYLDELVANQTPERKRAIATSIALVENLHRNNIKAFDARRVMGVFLRLETYDSFLDWPHANLWDRQERVDIQGEIRAMDGEFSQCEDGALTADIDYKIFCSDTSLKRSHIWGSYTNGAGLYKRSQLIEIGRMYGEPGDAFNDRYTEGNFAFRAGLQFCHSALRLTKDEKCDDVSESSCTGAFHHIGGGRGTRPMNAKGSACEDFAWNFFGTPMYDRFHKFKEHNTGVTVEKCSREELKGMRDRKFRDEDSKEYRQQVKESNKEVFERERDERAKIRHQASAVLMMLETGTVEALRSKVSWMAGKSDEEIRKMAVRLLKRVDSPHPMQGFWDSHGRIVDYKAEKG